MQPSEFEILREVEALRDIRRRSTAGGLGSLILDPDLPAASLQWSPTATDDHSSSSRTGGSRTAESSDDDETDPILGGDPSHLFWVPARLHPEIDPAEFRAFLKEHARNPAEGATGISRSNSVTSIGSLERKKSMLSRQYKPSANDGVEDEQVVPIRRNRTSVFSHPAPQLTISDLQKLEELAEEASKSDDPTKLRNVLRRSLSLNVSPTALAQLEDSPDLGDEADSPIVVPRPGQILRRAARTRKAGTIDGPHRFTSNRARRASTTARTKADNRHSSDQSSSDHGDGDSSRRHSAESDVPEVPPLPRPESYSEETSIYDAYASPDLDEADPLTTTIVPPDPEPLADYLPSIRTAPPQITSRTETPEDDYIAPTSPTPVVAAPVLHHPQPQRVLSPPNVDISAALSPPVRSPSPKQPPPLLPAPIPTPAPIPLLQPQSQPQSPSPQRPAVPETPPTVYQRPTSPSPSEQSRRSDRDKKGLFGKWGGDKSGKKGPKEKDPGFFGSFFGAKKKPEESSPPSPITQGAGREAAVALLGVSKSSKSRAPSPQPSPVNGFSRYPIHVERAIYRLSHIKLANPRRPLYEQVLISNLMFWYLGVINNSKSAGSTGNTAAAGTGGQTGTQNQANGNGNQQAQGGGAGAGGGASNGAGVGGGASGGEQAEKERKEREDRERAEKEKQEKEKEKERDRESKRRGSLTKNPNSGVPPSGVRRAEMPVRGPQYDMQHRAMEQEYGGYPGNQQRSPSAPPAMGGERGGGGVQTRGPTAAAAGSQGQQQQPQNAYSSVQLIQPQPQQPQQRYYNNNGTGHPPNNYGAPALPPGAMPPADVGQGYMGAQRQQQQQHSLRSARSPSPPPRSTSPPIHHNGQNNAGVGSSRRAKSPPAPSQRAHGQIAYGIGGGGGVAGVGLGVGGGKSPGRSLSATAAATAQPPPVPPLPPLANGKLKKGQSAHAVMSHQPQQQQQQQVHQRSNSEEEDMPLAYYQQQHRWK